MFKAVFVVLTGMLLARSASAEPAPAKAPATVAVPQNSIDCADWTHNADGSWTEKKTAKAFDVGDSTGLAFHGSTIHRNDVQVGGADLAQILDAVCAKP
jgi:hypothetical protein